ncbi:MAG: hypothetical protein WDM89_04545 [Rhizomicrobium sp.]
MTGFDEITLPEDETGIRARARAPDTGSLLRVAAQAIRQGFPIEEIAPRSRNTIRGSLGEIEHIVQTEARVRAEGLPGDATAMLRLKQMGFFRYAARLAERPARSRCARGANKAWRASGVQNASTPVPRSSRR